MLSQFSSHYRILETQLPASTLTEIVYKMLSELEMSGPFQLTLHYFHCF